MDFFGHLAEDYFIYKIISAVVGVLIVVVFAIMFVLAVYYGKPTPTNIQNKPPYNLPKKLIQ